MHDKENIFDSLVKSALNIYWLPLGEHFPLSCPLYSKYFIS